MTVMAVVAMSDQVTGPPAPLALFISAHGPVLCRLTVVECRSGGDDEEPGEAHAGSQPQPP